ncbi:MAG TPA: MarR family transcriptional regulator [Candidatus Dormibacteraeota bacterium]|nr:MarR family transcriptional regulator [Candidatus Dormibacteraeota bacterium]
MVIPVTPNTSATQRRQRSSTDELTDRIISDFRASVGTMKCAMSERLVRLGISMTQLNILYTLQRTGVMTMSHLAEGLGVSLSNLTGLVDRIEERGLIERTRVPEDRRVVLVRVTDAGTRLIQENDAVSDDLMRTVLARMDPAELPAIAHAFAGMRSALDATTATPVPRRRPS